MDLSLFLLVFPVFWKMTSSIRCYKCEPERLYDNSHIPLCEKFDYSERFITDCPYSTVCYKKDTVLMSLGLPTKSIQRGCALQTRDDEQVKVNGRWKYIKSIHEVYYEGCADASIESGRPTQTTNCYCRGDLCNSARRVASSLGIVVAAWWVVK